MIESLGDLATRRSYRMTGGEATAMPASPSMWLSAFWTSPHPVLIYTWCFIIAKATLKEMSSASASHHHPRHIIMSQKYMACHVLLLKYRPEKLRSATARYEYYPGKAASKRETDTVTPVFLGRLPSAGIVPMKAGKHGTTVLNSPFWHAG